MTDGEQLAPAPGQPGASREVDRWMYQFTAQLAHDMRAPMGAIFMWAHVLRAGDTGENLAAIDAIEASARQQSRMLGDVVDMARALVGRLAVDRARVDLVGVVSATVEEKAKEASARRVTIEWTETASPALTARADAKRLQQALGCLLSHGIAQSTGRRVTVGMGTALDSRLAELRLGVPTGGVEPSAVEDLFVPYRAQGLDLTAARPDFGIGLPFARAVVDLHGGTLDVENQGPGGDLTFVVRLPLDAAG